MLVGLGVGTVIEVLAIVLAFISTGFGHGSYVMARLLFPYSFLGTLLEGAIGPVSMCIGLIQFPLYGILIGREASSALKRDRTLLAVGHLVAAFVCFSGLLQDFS